MNNIIWVYESVWPKVWPQNKYRSLWPIFHGPVNLLYILKTIWCMYIILWEYESVRPDVWPIYLPYILKTIWCMNNIIWDYESVWPQNKYRSMVQWFCLISWRLFDAWTLLFGIMSQYDLKFYLKINIGHCDLYFMAQWFCVFLKTIWCMNIILWD